jgi:hypothetical protein
MKKSFLTAVTATAVSLAGLSGLSALPAQADTLASIQPCAGCLYHDYGGPVLSNAKDVYLIYYGFGSGDSALTTLPSFITSPNGTDYMNLLQTFPPVTGQSAISPAVTYGGSYFESAYLGSNLTSGAGPGEDLTANQDTQIVDDAILGGHLPNDPKGVYFVLTAPTVRNSGDDQFCGFHGSTAAGHISALIDFYSTDTVGCGTASSEANATAVISHELFEATTDPMVAAGLQPAALPARSRATPPQPSALDRPRSGR